MDVVKIIAMTICLFIIGVRGHGRLVEPPSRSSMWRFGFQTPRNYDDNGLNCGGKQRQWSDNGGKCGICGDPYDGERLNEVGGKYATGTIVRTYVKGQGINIGVEITAAHGGWFEFRVCAINETRTEATAACLNENLLQEVNGSFRHEKIPFGAESGAGLISLQYQLPETLTCAHCVFQWKYHTAKDWGCDLVDGSSSCAVGKGSQEEFFGCADVAILERSLPLKSSTVSTTTLTGMTGNHSTSSATLNNANTNESKMVPTTQTSSSKPSSSPEVSNSTRSESPSGKTTLFAANTLVSKKQTTAATISMNSTCQGRGNLKGSLMDSKCRELCRSGYCSTVFCNDVCQTLWS